METRSQAAGRQEREEPPAELFTAQVVDKLSALLERQQAQATEDRRVMQELLSRVLPATDGAMNDGVASGEPPVPAPRRHVSRPQVQAPHKLSPNVSLREFKIWRSAWADYEELLQLQEQPPGWHTSGHASPLRCAEHWNMLLESPRVTTRYQ